jgi:hypothetical protein
VGVGEALLSEAVVEFIEFLCGDAVDGVYFGGVVEEGDFVVVQLRVLYQYPLKVPLVRRELFLVLVSLYLLAEEAGKEGVGVRERSGECFVEEGEPYYVSEHIMLLVILIRVGFRAVGRRSRSCHCCRRPSSCLSPSRSGSLSHSDLPNAVRSSLSSYPRCKRTCRSIHSRCTIRPSTTLLGSNTSRSPGSARLESS